MPSVHRYAFEGCTSVGEFYLSYPLLDSVEWRSTTGSIEGQNEERRQRSRLDLKDVAVTWNVLYTAGSPERPRQKEFQIKKS